MKLNVTDVWKGYQTSISTGKAPGLLHVGSLT